MANGLCIIIGSISRNRPIKRYSELTKMAERHLPANTPGGAATFAHLLEEYRQRAGLSLGQPALAGTQPPHLLAVVFDPVYRSRSRPWEPLARRLVADFKWNTAALTHLPEYRVLWRELRALPDFRRIADVTPAAGVPGPSFVMGLHHSALGPLALRTATTLFSGVRDIHIVSYVPGDAPTLEAYRRMGWQGGS